MEEKELWLSILDYAQHRDISISTVRRHIKGNRVKWKLDGGKYFIKWNPLGKAMSRPSDSQEAEILKLKLEIQELKLNCKKLQEDVLEKNMLINLYESSKNNDLPEVPIQG